MKLIILFHPISRLRISGAICLFHVYVRMAHTGANIPFTLLLLHVSVAFLFCLICNLNSFAFSPILKLEKIFSHKTRKKEIS